MFNVRLPIMLKSERQAVYRERKKEIRRDGKSPDLKVNDKQLQTANLVYIFDDIILSVNTSKYGMLAIIELTSIPL